MATASHPAGSCSYMLGRGSKVLPPLEQAQAPEQCWWAAQGSGQGGDGLQCRPEHFTPLKFLFVVPVLELQVLGHHVGFQLVLAVFLTILTSRVDPGVGQRGGVATWLWGLRGVCSTWGLAGEEEGSSHPTELL